MARRSRRDPGKKGDSSEGFVIPYLHGASVLLQRHSCGPRQWPSDSRRERIIARAKSRSGAQPDTFRGGDSPKRHLRADQTAPLTGRRSSLNEGRSIPEWPGDCQPGRTGGPSAPPTNSPRPVKQEASRGRKPPQYPCGRETRNLRMTQKGLPPSRGPSFTSQGPTSADHPARSHDGTRPCRSDREHFCPWPAAPAGAFGSRR